jgi:hypothetical protein
MADFATLFPNRFLAAVEFSGKDVTLTIDSVGVEAIGDEKKALVHFKETQKQLVLNRTNAENIAACLGRDVEDWRGKQITFYPQKMADPFDENHPEIVAIRVRGSPELSAPVQKEVRRGSGKRSKVIRVNVVPTKAGKENGAAPEGRALKDVKEAVAKVLGQLGKSQSVIDDRLARVKSVEEAEALLDTAKKKLAEAKKK